MSAMVMLGILAVALIFFPICFYGFTSDLRRRKKKGRGI